MNEFSFLSEYYDRINSEGYASYAEFLSGVFADYAKIPVKEVLDLGCGTGGIAALLADKGFDMIGVDASPDMLSVAAEANKGKNTLLLCQDMTKFELYGTVQAVYSSYDCLNYLTTDEKLDSCFKLVANYLEKGGLFVFDVNTRYRYETIFADNNYVYEFDDDMLVWRNFWSEKDGSIVFLLDLFARADGNYVRCCESQTQRFHSDGLIEQIASKNGFSLAAVFGNEGRAALADNSQKAYYVFCKQ